MKRKKTLTKSARNARLLLTGYWGYKLYNGGDFLKTTLDALQTNYRLSRREKQRETQKARKEIKTRRASILGSVFLRRIISKILKSARLY